MFEPNNEPTPSFVDPNTDDLDEFSKLMTGQAKIKEEVTEEVTQADDDSVTEQEDVTEVEGTTETEDHDDEPEVSEEPKPKKVNKVQERINELVAKAREAERREAELQRKLDELAAKETAPKAAAAPKVQDGPTPDDKNDDGSEKYPLGEYDPQYIRDLTRHTIQKEQAELREQEAKERATRQEAEAREALHAQWQEKLAPATEKYEDFLDKTMELEGAFDGLDPQYSDYLANTIKSLDHGPDVLYYFATHLDEAERFVKMGPLQATLALGEINAMFKGNARKETKVSKAPPPPQVNKGSKTRSAVTADTDDLDAFSEMFFKKR